MSSPVSPKVTRLLEVAVILLIVTIVLVIMVPAFLSVRDGDLTPHMTTRSLEVMGTYISEYCEHADQKEMERLRHAQSLEELWANLHAKKIEGHAIAPVEGAGDRIDAWGHPYTLQVKSQGPEMVVRIISSGPNGVFEDGEGDDLYVEVRWSGNRSDMSLKSR